MSANFLDKSGLTAGCDFHTYITDAPPPATAVPFPLPRIPHTVVSAHCFPSKSWRIAHSVTTDNWATLQSGWAMLLVPHAPTTAAPPHPLEALNIAAIILTSSAAPVMSAHSVTGEGTALCTALIACGGLNLDCGDPGSASVDFNLNTVKTKPTLGDYIAAIVSTLLNVLYSWGLGKVVGKIITDKNSPFNEIVAQLLLNTDIAIVQTVLDVLNAVLSDLSSWIGDPVAVAIGKFAGWVQGKADGQG